MHTIDNWGGKIVKKKYRVTLTEEERGMLKKLVATGKATARKITYSRILLPTDEDSEEGRQIDDSIVKALHVSQYKIDGVLGMSWVYGGILSLMRI